MVFYCIKATLGDHQKHKVPSHSATFTVSKRRYYNAIVEVLGGKSGAMTP